MKSWFANYTSSPGAEPIEVTVLASEKKLSIGYRADSNRPVTIEWLIEDLQASAPAGAEFTRVLNQQFKGAQLEVRGKEAAKFIGELQMEQAKPWHQKDRTREWGRNGLILTGVLGLLLIAYFLLVPWLSEQMAKTVSVKREQQFGQTIYEALRLDDQQDDSATAAVNEFFREMRINTAYPIEITVVNGPEINAFALPGGHIVIYSALLKELKTYPELAALLSHEFTHVNNQHSTRSIFRRLGSRIFISSLFGRFGSVASVMADQADNLKSLTYSRKLEREADLEGLQLLEDRAIDPDGFTRLFQHLKLGGSGEAGPEFLASHPDIDNRIEYIREARRSGASSENLQLKTIFEKLKANIP